MTTLPALPPRDVFDCKGDPVGRSDESILKWGMLVRRQALEEAAQLMNPTNDEDTLLMR